MAPLHYASKFNPFLSLECAPCPPPWRNPSFESKERKGSNFAIWQHCFQTHTTPVLLACGERAELATEEYLPVTPIMEGFVILKKNPDY